MMQNNLAVIQEKLSHGYAMWGQGHLDVAEEAARHVLGLSSQNSAALHLLGLVGYSVGKYDIALDMFRRACAADEAPASFLSNLAEACRLNRLHDEGEKAARAALDKDPQCVTAWNNLGIILQEKGQYDESVRCLEHAVGLKKDFFEAWGNLGNTYKKCGQLQKALTCYHKALALNQNYVEAHSNLSVLYKDYGEYDKAAREAEIANKLNPYFYDAYINAAAIETARNQHEIARLVLGKLLQIAPDHLKGMCAMVHSLIKLEDSQGAVNLARKITRTYPDDGDARLALAQALYACGKVEEALQALEGCERFKTEEADAAPLFMAQIYAETNRKSEAARILLAIYDKRPDSVGVIVTLADNMDGEIPGYIKAQLVALHESSTVESVQDRVSLCFSLSNIFMNEKDYEAAFRYLDEGNRLKRATVAFDIDETKTWMKNVTSVFTTSFVEKHAGRGNKSTAPLFIVGMPRSGTTLLEQIFAAHPLVHGAGELLAFQKIINSSGASYLDFLNRMTDADLTRVGNAYIDFVNSIKGDKPYVVDKMPANFIHAGLINLALPNARIIHCRRHPVDTCVSCYSKNFAGDQKFTYNQTELGQFYKAYESMMDHWREVLPSDRFIEVHYEDLVEDLEGQARRLIDFCGLDWDESCLTFYQGNRAVRTSSLHQVRKPIYKSSVSRWLKVAPYIGPLLKELGVDESDAVHKAS